MASPGNSDNVSTGVGKEKSYTGREFNLTQTSWGRLHANRLVWHHGEADHGQGGRSTGRRRGKSLFCYRNSPGRRDPPTGPAEKLEGREQPQEGRQQGQEAGFGRAISDSSSLVNWVRSHTSAHRQLPRAEALHVLHRLLVSP